MALLSAIDGGSSGSLTSTISGESLVIFFLFAIGLILIVGLVWLICKSSNLIDEKKKYYKKLSDNMEKKK